MSHEPLTTNATGDEWRHDLRAYPLPIRLGDAAFPESQERADRCATAIHAARSDFSGLRADSLPERRAREADAERYRFVSTASSNVNHHVRARTREVYTAAIHAALDEAAKGARGDDTEGLTADHAAPFIADAIEALKG